jgi:RNA-directed DNA polymerase
MPIGSFLSQWSGNVYLDGLDHFVKRVLKVPGYVRYMDDVALFADDAGALVRAREAIAAWLARERPLTLNRKRWDVCPTAHPAVFLGYRVSRAGLSPSRKIRRRLGRRIRHASGQGYEALGRCVRSYKGLLSFG